MVNEDILGGIEVGSAKGESIESIMMGFYNSGYSREDIEWAAKAFQLNQFKVPGAISQAQHFSSFLGKKDDKGSPQKESSSAQVLRSSPYVKQHVSSYDQASQFRERVILIVLVSSLILLLGILVGVFLFKEQLVSFINSLFSG